jgi:hypothetical protein
MLDTRDSLWVGSEAAALTGRSHALVEALRLMSAVSATGDADRMDTIPLLNLLRPDRVGVSMQKLDDGIYSFLCKIDRTGAIPAPELSVLRHRIVAQLHPTDQRGAQRITSFTPVFSDPDNPAYQKRYRMEPGLVSPLTVELLRHVSDTSPQGTDLTDELSAVIDAMCLLEIIWQDRNSPEYQSDSAPTGTPLSEDGVNVTEELHSALVYLVQDRVLHPVEALVVAISRISLRDAACIALRTGNLNDDQQGALMRFLAWVELDNTRWMVNVPELLDLLSTGELDHTPPSIMAQMCAEDDLEAQTDSPFRSVAAERSNDRSSKWRAVSQWAIFGKPVSSGALSILSGHTG